MFKDLFTGAEKADKLADRSQTEDRSRNPMPEGWRPPAEIPYHQFPREAGRPLPPQTIDQGVREEPADANRPASPAVPEGE